MNDLKEQTQRMCEYVRGEMPRLLETLGERNPQRFGYQMRYGRFGSLAVTIWGPDAGQWYSHEDGIGGGPYDLIMWKLGVSFKDARQWLMDYLGGAVDALPSRPIAPVISPQKANSSEGALRLWQRSESYEGTIGEAYLRSRGITANLSHDCVRFNPRTFWRHGDETGYAPGLILLIRDMVTGEPQAVQRRYLNENGGKHPLFAKAKSYGPTAGGAIMLTGHKANNGLNICEGFEDAASALCLGFDGGAWAVCGTSGLKNLNPLAHIPAIRVFADNDEIGIVKANECAARWRAVGKFAKCYTAPNGHDLNAYLMAGGTK